jgi:hypothetical protein
MRTSEDHKVKVLSIVGLLASSHMVKENYSHHAAFTKTVLKLANKTRKLVGKQTQDLGIRPLIISLFTTYDLVLTITEGMKTNLKMLREQYDSESYLISLRT